MLRSSLFHPDGCVRANIRTQDYRVFLTQDCPHTKIKAAEIILSAESESDAIRHVQAWLKLPQTHVSGCELIPAQPEENGNAPG